MKLIIITALIAACSTAKLDRTYLPPPSANTAGGTPDLLQTPLIKTTNQGAEPVPQSNAPLGSYTNEFQGVVVDAAAPGVRASENELSGLGAPRPSYGSTDSKVGEAAFRGSAYQANIGNGEVRPERPQSFKDRNSNILTYSNDVNNEAYSYGFETDNGIAVGENGVAVNGVQAQGGYSYMGDDGQVYKVTYVADENGYRPQGDHLPTPHPIPEEILKSLEQNAKEEAAGVVDDGSYDAQKYNSDGDYTANKGGNIQHNGPQLSQFGNRPGDASASGSFINQNNQPFRKPDSVGGQNQPNRNGVNQFGNGFASNQDQGLTASQSQVSQNQGSLSGLQNNAQIGQHSGNQLPQFAHSQNNFDNHASQFAVQSQNNQAPEAQFGSQFELGANSQAGKPIKPSFGENAVVSGNNQFGNQAFKPQGSNAGFGKPSQFHQQSQYSQSNNQFIAQGINRPLNNNNQHSTAQSQFNKFGAASSNNAINKPQASNQYEYNNEYLPPKNDFGSKPQTNGGANFFNSANQGLNQNRPSQTFNQVQGFQNSAAGSNTVGQFGTQSEAKPDNFPSQSQSVPNKFAQNFNSQSFGQSQFNSQATPSKPLGPSNSKPTLIPDTELTTPLLPNEIPSSPQFDTQSTVSFGSFNQPSNQLSQSQQLNSQSNAGSPLSPVSLSLPGKPSSGPQSGIKPHYNQRPQFSQNSFNQNQFAQSNDPYYYNQPSKPFGTAQGSRFPSSPSYQSNVGFSQNSQSYNQVSSSNIPNTPISLAPSSPTPSSQIGQVQGSSSNFNSITQAAISPFPSASPTSTTQFNKPQNNQFGSKPNFNQNSFNQQQLLVSSPTSSIPSRPQFNQTPVVSQTEPTEPTNVAQTDVEGQLSAQNQQYSGTIYEYNKPAQTLPSSQSDNDSSQTVQLNTASPKPLQDKNVKEPSSQIDSKPQSSFQASQFSQNSFTQSQQVQQPQRPIPSNVRPQFGSQVSGDASSQFAQTEQSVGNQISSQQQFSQPKPSSFPSTQSNFGQGQQFQGSVGITPQPNRVPQNNRPFAASDTAITGYPSHEDSKPQNGPAFPTKPLRQPALGLNIQPQPLPNKGFSQLNSKPQFNQNQFSQNTQSTQFTGAPSQPIQTQFGSNSFSQQNTFSQNQNGPSPIRPNVPFGQSSAFATVSQNQPNKPFSQSNPVNQFNQNQQASSNLFGQNQQISSNDSQGSGSSQINRDEPIKPEQPSQFGSQFSGFQGSQNLGFSQKGEEFEGPRQPPSFDDKTGYHY